MTRIAGRVSFISMGGNDISQYVTNVELPQSADQHDVTGLGDTYRKRIAGFKDANLRIQGHYDDSTGATGIDTILFTALGISTAWVYGPAGSAAGKRRYSGAASAGGGGVVGTTFDITTNVDGVVDFTFEGVVDGAPVPGVFP